MPSRVSQSDAVVLGRARFLERLPAANADDRREVESASELLIRHLRDPEGEFTAVWSADAIHETPSFDLNQLYPLVSAWVHIEPGVARDLLANAIGMQGDGGTLVGSADSVGRVTDERPPLPLLVHALHEYWTATGDDEFVRASLVELRPYLEWVSGWTSAYGDLVDGEISRFAQLAEAVGWNADELERVQQLRHVATGPTRLDRNPLEIFARSNADGQQDVIRAALLVIQHAPPRPVRVRERPVSPLLNFLDRRRGKVMAWLAILVLAPILLVSASAVFRRSMTASAVEITVGMARHHYEQGRYDEAERLYRDVLARGRRYFPAEHAIGVILFRKGEFGEAETYFRQAIARDPQSPRPAYSLAVTLYRQNKLEESEIAFSDFATRFGPAYPQLAERAEFARQRIAELRAVAAGRS